MDNENERLDLKLLRVKHRLTQKQFAERIGISAAHYNLIENGKFGSIVFWQKVQLEFGLTDTEMWGLINANSNNK